MSVPDQYWLHVPLETTPGMSIEAPPNKRITVLGRPARLLEREPYVSFISANAMVVKQWLLFDPMSEAEARQVLADLRARVPVLSMNMGAAFRIPAAELHKSPIAIYNGPLPTLIPGDLTPDPAWADGAGECIWNGQDVLGTTLGNYPSVKDERLITALDLYIASQYDYLPRSLFLAKLTILDVLAERSKRDEATIDWIDKKIREANALEDAGLSTGLRNLKLESHTSAIRSLVSRAVLSQGGTKEEAALRAAEVGRLYATRSKLSHARSTVDVDISGATQLARFVLNAAIQNPSILDVDDAKSA